MGTRRGGVPTRAVVRTFEWKDGNSVRSVRKLVRFLPSESRRGRTWSDPLSMQGLPSLLGQETASAGGLRKSMIFSMIQIMTAHPIYRSVAEIRALLVTLVREFSFSIPEGRNIRTVRTMMLAPTVVGEEDKGPQLPLTVTAIRYI